MGEVIPLFGEHTERRRERRRTAVVPRPHTGILRHLERDAKGMWEQLLSTFLAGCLIAVLFAARFIPFCKEEDEESCGE